MTHPPRDSLFWKNFDKRTMVTAILLKPEGSLPLGGHGVRDMVMCEDGTLALTPAAGLSHAVLRVTVSADGTGYTVSHMAGNRYDQGSADGDAEQARFYYPYGLAALPGGRLVVADFGNHRGRGVSAGGVVTTFAGSGERKTEDGVGTKASFNYIMYLAARPGGAMLVTEHRGHALRAIAPDTAKVTTAAGAAGEPGFVDGAAANARFNRPGQMAGLPGGTTLVCDPGNRRLRLLSADGATVSTLAGSGQDATTDGVGIAAAFSSLGSVAADCAGRAIVVDVIENPEYDVDEDGAAYERGEDYDVPQYVSLLRLVDVRTRAITTVLGPDGNRLEFAEFAKVAIDGKGRLFVANAQGLHLVTIPELRHTPGYFPLWSKLWWKPGRACARLQHPMAAAVVRVVLTVAACLMQREGRRRSARRGLPLPALPLELWYHVLSILETHQLAPSQW